MRLLPVVVLLGTLYPAAAAAQDSRLAARLDGVTAGRVGTLVDSARADSLPTEPLVQKALEGATMGATNDRITEAVRTLLANLRAARSALGVGATETDLVAGAASLRAGVTATALRELRASRPRESLTVPLAVLTDMLARGVPQDRASASVLALARRGGADADFIALRRKIEGDMQSGVTPAVPEVRPRGMPAPGAPTPP
jgi:hypothetical protein